MNNPYKAVAALLFLLLTAACLGAIASRPAEASAVMSVPRQGPPLVPATPVCGPAWSAVTAPNPGSAADVLTAVAAVSANDVWAVGYYSNTAGIPQTLVERWNGTAWSVVPSPNPGAGSNYLQSVAATGLNDAWAVGYYNTGTAYQTLILHWDGSAWTQTAS